MSTTLKLGLGDLFRFQDEAARLHLANSEFLKSCCQFISDGMEICTGALMNATFRPEKQTVIRRLAVDCLSHVVVSTRVALWGAFPEALSVQRGSIESSCQLLYVVKEKKYQTAAFEMGKKFDRISYDSASAEMGDLGASMDKLHGRFSEMASHSTAARSRFVEYELEGMEYDRLGFAVDSRFPELVAWYGVVTVFNVCNALFQAHHQEAKDFPDAEALSKLKLCFEELRGRFRDVIPTPENPRYGGSEDGGKEAK